MSASTWSDQPEASSKPCPPGADKILLLGLGNDILTDDAIGLNVVRRLRESLADDDRFDVQETMEMGLALLDFIVGYQAVAIVDSIQTGQARAGTVLEVDAAGLKQLTGRTPHFLGVGETLALGRTLGLPVPRCVKIFAVEVVDPFTLSTTMTPALQSALPGIVERVAAAVRAMAN
jgi:hydrogenase maturation protease